ncbi:MAG: type II toxin-antitoxin system VapC family toxin [Propionicimonas sp.]|uniref:type II toxin-antitoxin system VapC family toxin n=1 Tax=Propionicimonas sp. TaxID=1955623 RepID=UPI003D0C2AEA
MRLVDTDVLIAHLRGAASARDWLRTSRVDGPLAISVVTVAEITGGMRTHERKDVHLLLSAFRTEPVTEVVAHRAGELMREYRRSHSGIGIADYLIAATADTRGLELATLNVRHYPMFADLVPPFRSTR